MGTIDISYLSLLTGLLLLIIPVFYLWKFKNRTTQSHSYRYSTYDRTTLPYRDVLKIFVFVE